jgi:hypothetical protein
MLLTHSTLIMTCSLVLSSPYQLFEQFKFMVLLCLREKKDELFLLRELLKRWLNHREMVCQLSKFSVILIDIISQDILINIIQDLNLFIIPRMEVDTIQIILNQFKASQKDYVIRFKIA